MGVFDWLRARLGPPPDVRVAEDLLDKLSLSETIQIVHDARLRSDPARMRWTFVCEARAVDLPPVAKAILGSYVVEAPNTGLVVGGDEIAPSGPGEWKVGGEETFHTSLRVVGDERVFECEEGLAADLAAPNLGYFLLLHGHTIGAFDLRALVRDLKRSR